MLGRLKGPRAIGRRGFGQEWDSTGSYPRVVTSSGESPASCLHPHTHNLHLLLKLIHCNVVRQGALIANLIYIIH
jgi:hypothetical protein